MATLLGLTAYGILGLFSVGSGARLRLQRNYASENFNGWSKGTSAFVCMKKWQKNGVFGSLTSANYCLVNLEEIFDAHKKGGKSKNYKMMVSTSWLDCESQRKTYAMSVCDLKGKEDRRVSYNNHEILPKACFRISRDVFKPDGKTGVTIFKAAVTARACQDILRTKPEGRGRFAATVIPASSSMLNTRQEDHPFQEFTSEDRVISDPVDKKDDEMHADADAGGRLIQEVEASEPGSVAPHNEEIEMYNPMEKSQRDDAFLRK